ncbi:YfhO family protein [Bacillus sp. T3]|uniref:YfhO family protein n=1 Tax=Bacillus sp. T3 TaxID=467262 RepID=UPI002981FAFF|nr:YfhO family protein [Bacillus sp. T3]
MKKIYERLKKFVPSFILPFLLLGGVFALWRVYPFGERSILMADQFTQYIQFYNYFYNVLTGNGSIFYAWEAGMGLNFWATFAYYLSSPVSVIVLFFGPKFMPEAFILMSLIKIGLAGLMMNVYLSNMIKGERLNPLLFSTAYALISFSIGYFFNIMWLDAIYMLPMVLLGVEKLFTYKYKFLIISLAILFIANFYIAYMVGIFTFLYFIIRIISIENSDVINKLKIFASFFVCTLLAGGLSAFITVPTFLHLKNNTNQPTNWEGMLDTSFGFFEFSTKLYTGSTHLFDMPNVYSGVFVLLLFPLFFINSIINIKEKIMYFLLLWLLFLSFQIKGINIIWHAFEEPVGYEYRFSFVFSFVLIYLAYRAYCTFDKRKVPSLFIIYAVNVFILMLLTKLTPEWMSIKKALLNIGFMTIFSLLLYLKVSVSSRRNWVSALLLITICIEMSFNAYHHVKTLNSYPGYSIPRNVYNANSSFEHIIKEMNNNDSGLFRTNAANLLTANDSMRFGYNGMTNFNTLSNGTLHKFLNELGYSTTLGPRSAAQNNGILSTDAMFGFKYAVTNKSINKHGYKKMNCKGEFCLYENQNVLPIGFVVDKKQVDFNISEDNPFIKQNTFIGSELFTKAKANSTRYNNLEVTKNGSVQLIKKIKPELEGSIEKSFDLSDKKQFYMFLSAGKGFAGFNETNIYINGKPLGVYPTYHNERVLDLGAFSNERVTVKIEFVVPETQLSQEMYYALDMKKFEQQIDELKSQSLKVSNWTNTKINGDINVQKANTLFLSIPYDRGWKATLDGEPVKVEKLGGFIGFDIQQGTHSIELKYLPPGFILGCIVTIGCSIILIISRLLFKKKNY